MTTTEKKYTLIRWAAQYEIGLPVIDSQHKKLVNMINDLYSCFLRKDGLQPYIDVIQGLVNYTQYHFSTEEKLMRQCLYPEYAAHKKEHESFIVRIVNFRSEIERGNITINYTIINYLRKWLVNHISISDQKYVALFTQHGLDK